MLGSTRYVPNAWITRAVRRDEVIEVTIQRDGGSPLQESCDYLATGFGFVGNTELAELIGCKVENGCVAVDTHQQTSIAGVYCAGEPTGVGGIEQALAEGEVAGSAAVGREQACRAALRTRRRARDFANALDECFRLRPELRAVPQETIVCRCEDVEMGKLAAAKNWREAKLHYRCGMGPCQGRVCGPAVEFLFGYRRESVRPPLFPTNLINLIKTFIEENSER
jgi:pyruvate/2-oxoglutarate dehydrogenase complex dihydrolipoamide dehydrogenase (E3) component